MIARAYVRLMGGLGNQLFQAAFALWLRETHGIVTYLFDPGLHKDPGPLTRSRQIDQVIPSIPILTGRLANVLHYLSLSHRWQGTLGRAGIIRLVQADQHLTNGNGSSLLAQINLGAGGIKWLVFSGYYQDASILNVVLPNIISRTYRQLAERARRVDSILISNGQPSIKNSMVVHVRRGDYLTTPGFRLLKQDYYLKARTLIGQRDPIQALKNVCIVSDHPAEALSLIRPIYPQAKVLDLLDPLDVLAAIAYAPQKIIANSTLSLWGALLGNSECVVAYPGYWHDNQDIGVPLCRGRDWLEVPNCS